MERLLDEELAQPGNDIQIHQDLGLYEEVRHVMLLTISQMLTIRFENPMVGRSSGRWRGMPCFFGIEGLEVH